MNIATSPQWRDAWAGILFVVNLCGLLVAPHLVLNCGWGVSTLGYRFSATLQNLISGIAGHLFFGGILVLLLLFLTDIAMHVCAFAVGHLAIHPCLLALEHLVVKSDALSFTHQVVDAVTVMLALIVVILFNHDLVESSRIIRAEKVVLKRIPVLWAWIGTMLAGLLLMCLSPTPTDTSTLANCFFIYQGLGLFWLVLVAAAVGQSIVASLAIVELDGGEEKEVLMLAAKRSLTTSFGSLCIAAVVSPVKLLMGKPDSHAYTKMALANMSYSEASADAPQSELAKHQVISLLVVTLLGSLIPQAGLSFLILNAGLHAWPTYSFAVFGPLLAAKMWLEGASGAVLLKWEDNEAYMLQRFPQISPIAKHPEESPEPRQKV